MIYIFITKYSIEKFYEVSNKYGNRWITSQDRVFMKNFSHKSCRKSSKTPDEDLEIDLDLDLQGHLKVNSENLNRNHCFGLGFGKSEKFYVQRHGYALRSEGQWESNQDETSLLVKFSDFLQAVISNKKKTCTNVVWL